MKLGITTPSIPANSKLMRGTIMTLVIMKICIITPSIPTHTS